MATQLEMWKTKFTKDFPYGAQVVTPLDRPDFRARLAVVGMEGLNPVVQMRYLPNKSRVMEIVSIKDLDGGAMDVKSKDGYEVTWRPLSAEEGKPFLQALSEVF